MLNRELEEAKKVRKDRNLGDIDVLIKVSLGWVDYKGEKDIFVLKKAIA